MRSKRCLRSQRLKVNCRPYQKNTKSYLLASLANEYNQDAFPHTHSFFSLLSITQIGYVFFFLIKHMRAKNNRQSQQLFIMHICTHLLYTWLGAAIQLKGTGDGGRSPSSLEGRRHTRAQLDAYEHEAQKRQVNGFFICIISIDQCLDFIVMFSVLRITHISFVILSPLRHALRFQAGRGCHLDPGPGSRQCALTGFNREIQGSPGQAFE